MHPYFDKFTDRVRHSLQLANEEARIRCCPLVGSKHILCGILQDKDNIAYQILEGNVKIPKLSKKLDDILGYMNYKDHGVLIPYAEDGRKCLVRSIEAMLKMHGRYLGCQHLLLGLLAGDDMVSQMLNGMGITTDLVMKEIEKIVA